MENFSTILNGLNMQLLNNYLSTCIGGYRHLRVWLRRKKAKILTVMGRRYLRL